MALRDEGSRFQGVFHHAKLTWQRYCHHILVVFAVVREYPLPLTFRVGVLSSATFHDRLALTS